MNTALRIGIFLTASCWLLSPCLAAPPSDFRIETDITLAGQAQPIHQSVTIFLAGVAYDYSLAEPNQVTIIHPGENRIVFLDSKREIQSQISLSELKTYIESSRKELSNSTLAAALEDANLVQSDPATMTVTVGKNFFRYQATAQKLEDASLARLFADFANASACINAWQAPDRSPPSFARMQLNQAIAELQAIPVEITRTTITSGGQQHVHKSRLYATWQISSDDKKLVEKFSTMLLTFPTLDVKDYFVRGVPTTSGNAQTPRSTLQR